MVRNYRKGDTLEDIDDALKSPYRPAGIERTFEGFEDEKVESPRLRQDIIRGTELPPSSKPSLLKLSSKEKET